MDPERVEYNDLKNIASLWIFEAAGVAGSCVVAGRAAQSRKEI
jgi:hypothetical protein